MPRFCNIMRSFAGFYRIRIYRPANPSDAISLPIEYHTHKILHKPPKSLLCRKTFCHKSLNCLPNRERSRPAASQVLYRRPRYNHHDAPAGWSGGWGSKRTPDPSGAGAAVLTRPRLPPRHPGAPQPSDVANPVTSSKRPALIGLSSRGRRHVRDEGPALTPSARAPESSTPFS